MLVRHSDTPPRPDVSDRDKVSVRGQTMAPSGCIIRAIFDPGLFVNRGDNYEEPLHRWQARAVVAALTLAGYSITAPTFASYCPHCYTGDPGEDYCGSCGEAL